MLALPGVGVRSSQPLLGLQLGALALAEQAKDADMLFGGSCENRPSASDAGPVREGSGALGGRHRVARRSPILKFGQVLLAAAQTAPFLLAQALLVLGYPITALEASPSSLDTARQRSGPIM